MTSTREILETHRLYLRPLAARDAEFLLAHFGDDEVTRYLVDAEPLTSRADADRIVAFYQDAEHGQCRWMLVDKRTGATIGTCGFHMCEPSYHKAEVGYDLASSHWGQGLMTEALAEILAHAFTHMEMNRIEALVHPDNHQSIALLDRLGFLLEGTIRDRFWFRGRYYDHRLYSLLRREWSA